jgi:hypothetical protein
VVNGLTYPFSQYAESDPVTDESFIADERLKN